MAKQVKIDIVAKDKTKNAISSTKKSLGGLTKFAIAAGVAMAGIAAVKGIKDLARVGKEIESLKIRFGFLFGTVKEGEKAFDNLAKFAAKVPFSLGEISAASGNLAVVAKDAKDLSRILEITGNVAAVTGLDFQTTASQIQRAFSGGIAAADVFREKGVRSLLGFKQGAKVSIEDTVKAFEDTFSGNGRFGKATDELATTLAGTLSMIGDKFFQFKQAINEAFFAELKVQFGDLNEALENNKSTWMGWGETIGVALATTTSETVQTLNLLTSTFGALDRTVQKNNKSTAGIVDTFLALHPVIKTSLDGITQFFDKNEEWSAQLDSINPKITNYATSISDVQKQFPNFIESVTDAQKVIGGLGLTIVEETTPALTQLEQDLLDLQIALEPLGNAFDTAFAPLDEALAKSEENRKQTLENSFKDFKNTKFKEIDFEKMTQKEREQMTKAGFRTALSEGAKHNKAMFRLNQALNIGEAIMNTATGITGALKLGPVGIPLAIAIGAMGAVQIAAIASQQPPAQFGGSRLPNSPFLVGEKGPELFTPNTAGSVTPNHQLGGGGATVNFNITTVDAQSFGTLLDTRRGQIVNMINSALNNKGQAALV